MRTTLNIDDAALAAAMDSTPGKTKTAVINDALREGLLSLPAWP